MYDNHQNVEHQKVNPQKSEPSKLGASIGYQVVTRQSGTRSRASQHVETLQAAEPGSSLFSIRVSIALSPPGELPGWCSGLGESAH